jgi:hypothetical protein
MSVASEENLVVGHEVGAAPTAVREVDDALQLQALLLFCLNEVLFANSLLSRIKRDLVLLDLLLQGRIHSDGSSSATVLLNTIANGRVPEEWLPGCKVPVASWISNFTARVRALHMWVPEAALANMPVFWLPHIHNPCSLFAALKLAAATKEGTSIDHIQIEWEVTKKPYVSGQSAPLRVTGLGSSMSYCVSFGGISLIGAQWSPFTQVLEDCDPDAVNPLPVITARTCFKPPSVDSSLVRPSHAGFGIGEYNCPVYSDRSCAHLLFSMKLKSLVHSAKWAMIGVHAVLSSDSSP